MSSEEPRVSASRVKAFVSYARVDLAFVDRLAGELQALGFEVLMDRKDILPAEPWRNRLSQLVLEADAVIFVITARSIASEVCSWELAEAERMSKRLVPLVHEAVDTSSVPALARLNFLYMRDSDDFLECAARLAVTLRTDIAWVREHTRLGTLAEGWNSRGRPDSEILRGNSLAAAEQWIRLTPTTGTQPTTLHAEYIAVSRRRFDFEEQEKKNAMEGFMISQSRFLAGLANRQTEMGDAVTGALIALEGLPQEYDVIPRPYVAAAEFALINAYYRIRESRILSFNDSIAAVTVHPDGDTLAVALRDSTVEIRTLSGNSKAVVGKGHTDEVTSVRFSSSGHRLLSTSKDETCIVWDFPSMRILSVLKGDDDCDQATISADDSVILTKFDKVIAAWDGGTFRRTASWKSSSNSTYAFDASSDGLYAVTGSGRFAFDLLERDDVGENVVRIWDVRTGKKIAEWADLSRGVLDARLHPADPHRVLVGLADGTAGIWAWSGNDPALLLKKHTGRVLACAWSLDGRRAITTSEDGTACVWSAHKGKLLAILSGHGQVVNGATFLPGGKRALTYSRGGTAHLWDCKTGAVPLTLRGHEGSIRSVAVLDKGRRALTAAADQTVRIWNLDDAANGEKISWNEEKRSGEQLLFSPDSQRLLVIMSGRAQLVNVADSTEMEIRNSGEEHFSLDKDEVAFSSSGERLSLRMNGKLAIYDAVRGTAVATLEHKKDDIKDARFSPDGSQILTISERYAQLWNARDCTSIDKFQAPSDKRAGFRSGSFSADGRHVVAIPRDGRAYLWSSANHGVLAIGGENRSVNAAMFHPSLPACVTGGRDGIHVWSLDGNLVREFSPSELSLSDSIRELAFSPNGNILMAKSSWDDDDKLSFWDFASGNYLGEIGGSSLDNKVCVFSPDSTRLVTVFHAQIPLYGSLSSARATLWTLPDVAWRGSLADVGDEVGAAAFDPHSRFLATGHDNGAVRLWDAHSGEAIASLEGQASAIQDIAFSPDGRLLATLSYRDRIIRRMFDSTKALVDEARRIVPRGLSLEQRKQFFVSAEPPDWCIELDKWPFHCETWKKWLVARRAGEHPELPEAAESEATR